MHLYLYFGFSKGCVKPGSCHFSAIKTCKSFCFILFRKISLAAWDNDILQNETKQTKHGNHHWPVKNWVKFLNMSNTVIVTWSTRPDFPWWGRGSLPGGYLPLSYTPTYAKFNTLPRGLNPPAPYLTVRKSYVGKSEGKCSIAFCNPATYKTDLTRGFKVLNQFDEM